MALSERSVLILELVFLEMILGLAIWLPSQVSQYQVAKIAGFFLISTTVMHWVSGTEVKEKLCGYGFHFKGLESALALLIYSGAFALLGYIILKLSGRNTSFDSHDTHFYPVWSTLQQAGILLYVWPRLLIICKDNRRALLWICVMYSSLHLPNLALMVLVCVQMFAFVPVYAKLKSVWGLPLLATSHYIVGETVSQVIPVRILCDNHVGIWYVYDKWYALKNLAMTCGQWIGLNS